MVAIVPSVRKRKNLDKGVDFHGAVELDNNGKLKGFEASAPATVRPSHLAVVSAITLIAALVRFYRISEPSSVVFDEVHFGGFASKYIKREFFMDVHPPLAKMMIAAVGYVTGFDGSFMFEKIGLDYVEPNVPYVAMRLLPAVLGWLLVPIAYFTLRGAHCSHLAASLGAFVVTFENSYTAQFRHILLDSPLVFFTALTILAWVHFQNQLTTPFTAKWWFWLTATGVSLGLTGSVKWVGLFLYATIGVSTLAQLWDLIGDLSITPSRFARELLARGVCLILLPGAIYMSLFQVHLMWLAKSGTGNGFMSPQFRSSLQGGSIPDTLRDIAYGAKLKIRHVATNSGYLHSHPHFYPSGSRQQQVTLYSHRDYHNDWVITKAKTNTTQTGLEWVKNGDVVRLLHSVTNKRLHSHSVKAPVSNSKIHFEVSGYEWGDDNDLWKVVIYDHDRDVPESADRLMAFHSKFKLVHTRMSCDLYSSEKKLPKWGFDQLEVACMRQAKPAKTLWMVDTVTDARLPEDSAKANYPHQSFLQKFTELHRTMWKINAGLASYHPYGSRPADWPLLRRGISFWGKEHSQVYLLGNPVVWWITTLCLGLSGFFGGILVLRRQRGYQDDTLHRWLSSVGLYFVGWALHFLPFFLMSRQLFLHHYLPALYFAILLTCTTLDHLIRPLHFRARTMLVLTMMLTVLYVYLIFSPITYGYPWTKEQCKANQWRAKWDFDCARMLSAHQ
ncbi:glycosyltransferase family 39 protein [Basidiobolus meristosporus CBS 931.73]|uniref:Dolichyl-phosphate-mannose--protein mannosyltransferase n=1 Tax=Basidiobolus meristosporus CBS 931.73 TaxID=1314790 RepID=A0A1Y1X8X7_9FUNG|nr:glycosyltransferase family 39 protein [Basidiobolus meristosporus CBS 931.73]|eukprot:ORX81804.1 glycosyltransferase family 39 protein [Basidiobolus meristosporus CBS 931.73]